MKYALVNYFIDSFLYTILEIRFALDYNKDGKNQSNSVFFNAIDINNDRLLPNP